MQRSRWQPRMDSREHVLEAFYRGMGHLAISRHETLWGDAGRFSLVSHPSNQKVAATKHQIQQLLVDTGKWIALFCPTGGSGPTINEYTLQSRDYGLQSLQRQFRNHVRRHGADARCRELTWEEMLHQTGDIHADLAVQWKQASAYEAGQDRWAAAWAAARETPGLFAYGCFLKHDLAGYIVAWIDGETCHGVLLHRNSHFDGQRIANVLLYNFSATTLAKPGIRKINMGRSWFPVKPSLDRFKRHAGYEEGKTTLAVVLHPKLEPFLRSRATHYSLGLISRISRGRLNFEQDLPLLRAARQTEID
jgi:hypothetical protein